MSRRGFTLVELLVAVSISVVLTGATYLSLNAALDSWHYTRDELALQQVVGGLLEEVLDGTDWNAGLRSALEVTRADPREIRFVPPWSERQQVSGGQRSFQLSRYVKPGTGLPTAELRLPDGKDYQPVSLAWEDPDKLAERPRVKPAYDLVAGSTLRLSYHPDPERVPEAVVVFGWDPESGVLYRRQAGEETSLGENPLGVSIADFRFRYYDQTNALVAEDADVREDEMPLITAVEVELTGRMGSHELKLVGMVMLRNSLRQSGLLILRDGLRAPAPDSRSVQTLLLTNLTGITHGDEIQLELRPRVGQSWRVSIRFEKYGQVRPVVGQVTVEYPPGHVLFTDRPRTSVDLGIDLLTLGSNGLYDYDDDPDVKDTVLVEGETLLTVSKMDVGGAACFVQP